VQPDKRLTQKLRLRARELGADLIGVAPVSRYEHAPKLMSPQGHWPEARNIVVVAIHHTDGVIEMGGRDHPQRVGPYNVQGVMNSRNEHMVWELARLIHAAGWDAMPMPATNIWRFRPYGEVDHAFVPDVSNIHAAAAAGLGEIGYNGLLLSPEFGPRQRFCTLISNAPLEATPLYNGPELCDRCRLCAKHCLTQAFDMEVKGECEVVIEDKVMRYPDRNMWRCAWGEHFGLDLDLDKPDVITEEVIHRFLAEHGRRGGEMGSCLRYCLPPHLRHFDPEYTNTVRRRLRTGGAKPVDRPATVEAAEIAFQWGADWVAVARLETARKTGLDLRTHLPDAECLMVFGLCVPGADIPGVSEDVAAPVVRAVQDLAMYAELDIARAIERRGYAAIPRSGIVPEAALAAVGVEAVERIQVHNVVCSAPLFEQGVQPNPGDRDIELARALECIAGRRVVDLPEEDPSIRRFFDLLPGGVDLAGTAGLDRLDVLAQQLEGAFNADVLSADVVDCGGIHGPVKPKVVRTNARVPRRVRDLLPGARTVIVLGAAIPEITVRRAAEPPADGVGPYAMATYQARRELRYAAVALARALEARGDRALVADDLMGAASAVVTPRGRQPDASASRFAAVAAGLGTLMQTGAVWAPPFGNRVRFISIVTDAEFTPAPLFSDPAPCENCADKPCITACPTRALHADRTVLKLDDREFRFGHMDRLRCDWAAKFGLVGDEGPRWIGSYTDIPPPDRPLAVEDIVENYARLDPTQKHWMCVIDPCLRRCALRNG